MAACYPAQPLGETYEVHVRWAGDKRWYSEENGQGPASVAEAWAKELLNANQDIAVKIVRVVREEISVVEKGVQ